MNLPNKRGHKDSTGPLLPTEAFSMRIGLQLIELLVKVVLKLEPPKNSGFCQDYIGCSPQTDSKAPLLKRTSIQLIEHGEVTVLNTASLHSYVLASLVQEGTLHTTKGETQIPAQPQTL